MASAIEVRTERLFLRQWKAADRPLFAALNADPVVMAYFTSPMSREESDAMADWCERGISERGWGFWACETKATGNFIGFVGLHTSPKDLPVSPRVEIAWRLLPAYWGLGFATEAARGALRVGFDILGLPEIVAYTAISNVKSLAVMERLGMQPDQNTFEHPDVPEGHALRPHRVYRITREMWMSQGLPTFTS